MKSKKLLTMLSTAVILSTASVPAFARDLSYNSKSGYGYDQNYNNYRKSNDDGYGKMGYGNKSYTNISSILQSLGLTTASNETSSEIESINAAISTTKQSNLQISKQLNYHLLK